jgi:putative ABC transport system substrate-binding protein
MQFDQLKRREFMTLLGGAATWPLAVRAQQVERVRRIAVLIGGTEEAWGLRVAAFRQTLEQLGWKEGHNLQTDIRWGSNDLERIAVLARDIVSNNPEVILSGPSNTVIQAKNTPARFRSCS